MRIILFCPNYPSSESPGFTFVHIRAKLYKKLGHEVMGLSISNKEKKYCYENINVIKRKQKNIKKEIEKFNPDIIAVHFPLISMILSLRKIKIPQVAWIHGGEILWRFRQDVTNNIFKFIKKKLVLIPRELIQIIIIRFYLNSIKKVVFVSNWLKKNAEKHSLNKYKNSVIIPNPVDTELFMFNHKNPSYNGISLRSFTSSKYGLDLIIKALKNEKKIKVDIFGKGLLKNKYDKMKKKYNSNVNILETSIPHNKITELYKKYSFFVAPSRIETQGLAMCEAMACGLPVIAAKTGGIPEYVRDNVDGLLIEKNNPKAILSAINKLLENPEQYYKMSKNASENINKLCSQKIVISKELELMKLVINES